MEKVSEKYWRVLIIVVIIAVGISIPIGITMIIKANDVHIEDDEPPIASFNSKFEAYEGSEIRFTNIKQLCNETSKNNKSNERKVKIGIIENQKSTNSFDNSDPDNLVKENGEFGEEYNNLSVEILYNVKCNYDKNSGNVKSITIVKNK